jgi:hypothetical protein
VDAIAIAAERALPGELGIAIPSESRKTETETAVFTRRILVTRGPPPSRR